MFPVGGDAPSTLAQTLIAGAADQYILGMDLHTPIQLRGLIR